MELKNKTCRCNRCLGVAFIQTLLHAGSDGMANRRFPGRSRLVATVNRASRVQLLSLFISSCTSLTRGNFDSSNQLLAHVLKLETWSLTFLSWTTPSLRKPPFSFVSGPLLAGWLPLLGWLSWCLVANRPFFFFFFFTVCLWILCSLSRR